MYSECLVNVYVQYRAVHEYAYSFAQALKLSSHGKYTFCTINGAWSAPTHLYEITIGHCSTHVYVPNTFDGECMWLVYVHCINSVVYGRLQVSSLQLELSMLLSFLHIPTHHTAHTSVCMCIQTLPPQCKVHTHFYSHPQSRDKLTV